ncbi:SPX domain-containing membrane protein At4g11810 [Coccomyxa sp. Obi]|nr:SPX domain-containing membrane protein At4g11810 [Coccomyxa sp. Obi]
MRFGEKLKDQARPEWRSEYIDYDLLKKKIAELMSLAKDPKAEEIFKTKRHVFQGLLDTYIERVLSFYKQKLAEVRQRLAAANIGASADPTSPSANLDADLEKLSDLAGEVTHLLSYVSLNLTAVRKILKKMAKHIPPEAPTPGYLSLEIRHPHKPGYRLVQGTFLPTTVAAELDDMAAHDELNDAAKKIRDRMSALRAQDEGASVSLDDDAGRRGSLRRSQTLSAAECHMANFHRIVKELEDAEAQAKRNAGLVHAITYQEAIAGIFQPPPPDEHCTSDLAGLVLNCLVAGLYMASYMMMIPTAAEFCHHIGVSPGLVGMIAGASDFASMFATPAYSIWTNYNFRWPILAGAVTCLISNVMYLLSYDARSLTLLIASRFVMGFGSSRTVSRRYIADFVSRKNRMRASTAFVCASATGMALGPLLAQLLGDAPSVKAGPLTFDRITLAAWIMTAAWLVFIIAWAALFKDPLEEQRRRQRLAADAAEPDLERPLLQQNGSSSSGPVETIKEVSEEAEEEQQSWWDAGMQATLAAVLCLWALKLVQQGYVDGLSIFTGPLYGWSGSQNGLLMAVLGIASIPLSFLVGWMSPHISDRSLTAAALLATAVGATLCTSAGNSRDPAAYFGGGATLYMGSLILEGASMCLLSKVLPARLTRGLFNAGLLTTEAGTLGRFSGNIVMSVVARLTGVETSQELLRFGMTLYGIFAALLLLIGFYMLAVWRKLAT